MQPSQLISTNVSLSKCSWNQVKSVVSSYVVGSQSWTLLSLLSKALRAPRVNTGSRNKHDQDDLEAVAGKEAD